MITDKIQCHRCGEQVEITQYQFTGFSKIDVKPCACLCKGGGRLSARAMAEQWNEHMAYLRSLYGCHIVPAGASKKLPPERDRWGIPDIRELRLIIKERNTNTMNNYRETRNTRVTEAIASQLGAPFKPMPESNRQFENLTTAMKVVGAGKLAEVWIKALAIGKGKPAAILDAIKTVEKGVEDAPETVETSVEDTPETVEKGVETVESETVETVEDTPQGTPITKLAQIKAATAVLNNLVDAYNFVMGSPDSTPELQKAYCDLLKVVLEKVEKADNIQDARNRVYRAMASSTS